MASIKFGETAILAGFKFGDLNDQCYKQACVKLIVGDLIWQPWKNSPNSQIKNLTKVSCDIVYVLHTLKKV